MIRPCELRLLYIPISCRRQSLDHFSDSSWILTIIAARHRPDRQIRKLFRIVLGTPPRKTTSLAAGFTPNMLPLKTTQYTNHAIRMALLSIPRCDGGGETVVPNLVFVGVVQVRAAGGTGVGSWHGADEANGKIDALLRFHP